MMKSTTFTASLIIVSIFSSCLTKSTISEKELQSKGVKDVTTETEVKEEEDSFIDYFSDEIELDGFKSCAFGTYEEANKLFTPTIIDAYNLVKLDVDKEFEQVLKENYLDALYFPIGKKKMGEIYVLLYGLTYDKNDVYAREYRILIFKNDTILQNILFSASIASDGENNLCRELKVYLDRIELIKENAENVKYLNLPDIETYYFKPKSQETNLNSNLDDSLKLPIDIPYKSLKHRENPKSITQAEIQMLSKVDLEVSYHATISTLGKFKIAQNLWGELLRVLDNKNSATILTIWKDKKLVNKFLVQKYIKGQIGYSTTISKQLKLSRAEMFEIEQNGAMNPEVDHFDEFQIKENGEIIKLD